MKRFKLMSGSVLALIIYCVPSAQAALYVFGDSLSDAGNVWDASTSDPDLQPDPIVPPYYQGRMSNGKNWADYVADDLGLEPLTASRIGGGNYAWAGATTGSGTTDRRSLVVPGQVQPVDNVGTQIASFVADHGGFAVDDLVLYWSGANDIMYYALGNVPVSDAILHLTALTQANLLNLEALGATRIVLPNQIDSAKSPIWSGAYALPEALQPYVAAVTAGFNAELPGLIASLEGSADFEADIIGVDLYTLAEEVIADPAAFGLTDVTSPAFLTPGADPDTYLFWDPIHPTTAGHRLIADAVTRQVVPEPTTLIMLTAGLMAVWPFRRYRLSA